MISKVVLVMEMIKYKEQGFRISTVGDRQTQSLKAGDELIINTEFRRSFVKAELGAVEATQPNHTIFFLS